MRTRWFVLALFLASIVAGLQHWALADALYWRYVWFDIPMHYLGGLTIGALAVAFIMRYRPWIYVAAIAAIIIGWEVFEALIGSPREANYAFDTSLDLLIGTLGATTIYILARYTIWRSN